MGKKVKRGALKVYEVKIHMSLESLEALFLLKNQVIECIIQNKYKEQWEVSMIEWRNEFLLGIEKIDEQHKKLFQIASDIHALMKNKLVTDKYDQILILISELKDYTVFHFTSEEEYMKSIEYRKLFSHKVEHDDFIEKINNVDLDKVDLDHQQYLLEILEFVVNWISVHILETDKAYTVK